MQTLLNFKKNCICLYFWPGWVFVAACGSPLVMSRGYPLAAVSRASHCGGFSYYGEQALGHTGFSSCSSWTLWSVGSVDVLHGLSCSMALSPPLTKDWTHVPCVGRQILNHWPPGQSRLFWVLPMTLPVSSVTKEKTFRCLIWAWERRVCPDTEWRHSMYFFPCLFLLYLRSLIEK